MNTVNILAKNKYQVAHDSLEAELYFLIDKDKKEKIQPLINSDFKSYSKIISKYITSKKSLIIGEQISNLNSERTIQEHYLDDKVVPLVNFTQIEYPTIKEEKYLTDDFYGVALKTNLNTFSIIIKLNVLLQNVSSKIDNLSKLDVLLGDFKTYLITDSSSIILEEVQTLSLDKFAENFKEEITEAIEYSMLCNLIRKQKKD